MVLGTPPSAKTEEMKVKEKTKKKTAVMEIFLSWVVMKKDI